MNIANPCRCLGAFQIAACGVIACSAGAWAQESPQAEPVAAVRQGPSAALEFEKSFRDPSDRKKSKPIRLQECERITELTKGLWSKKHVLTDFKKHRTDDQIGVIVIVKTEYCCYGSRLCAVTTACLEKRSTPLVGRFRVYAGWIKNNPDHPREVWSQWEQDVAKEYDFIQGPGARVVAMVPTWDGKMYQWESTATKLHLSQTTFERLKGETPTLESFLQNALQYAPSTELTRDLNVE